MVEFMVWHPFGRQARLTYFVFSLFFLSLFYIGYLKSSEWGMKLEMDSWRIVSLSFLILVFQYNITVKRLRDSLISFGSFGAYLFSILMFIPFLNVVIAFYLAIFAPTDILGNQELLRTRLIPSRNSSRKVQTYRHMRLKKKSLEVSRPQIRLQERPQTNVTGEMNVRQTMLDNIRRFGISLRMTQVKRN